MFATKAAWSGKHEVVEVKFYPKVTSYQKLAEQVHGKSGWFALPVGAQCDVAKDVGLRQVEFAGEVPVLRADREPKYYLLQTPMRHVPMTELQAVRINAVVKGEGGLARARKLLSPRQVGALETIQADPKADWPKLVGVDVHAGWNRLDAFQASARRGR